MQAKTNLHARKNNMLSICFQLGQNLFLSAPKIKQLSSFCTGKTAVTKAGECVRVYAAEKKDIYKENMSS